MKTQEQILEDIESCLTIGMIFSVPKELRRVEITTLLEETNYSLDQIMSMAEDDTVQELEELFTNKR